VPTITSAIPRSPCRLELKFLDPIPRKAVAPHLSWPRLGTRLSPCVAFSFRWSQRAGNLHYSDLCATARVILCVLNADGNDYSQSLAYVMLWLAHSVIHLRSLERVMPWRCLYIQCLISREDLEMTCREPEEASQPPSSTMCPHVGYL
jgi:hypothetical protein